VEIWAKMPNDGENWKIILCEFTEKFNLLFIRVHQIKKRWKNMYNYCEFFGSFWASSTTTAATDQSGQFLFEF
jgi:hypothetical protein